MYIHKETKIFLPRILYYFAKDMSLPMPGLLERVNDCLSEAQRKAVKSGMKRGRFEKYINWLPENSTFRYVFHGELARGSTAVWSHKFWLCGLCIEVWKVQMLVLVSLFVFDRTPNVLSCISDKVSPVSVKGIFGALHYFLLMRMTGDPLELMSQKAAIGFSDTRITGVLTDNS